ncbi:hypothetical protein FGO68_gene13045 [Halteria grandinella]|uniref:Uncharacterized protein n=1 Tax=Halteria grandinella TaxID=5974 RepID=A0A8J8P4W5_HALGN|nr:hypothetical protein FGO68_gene13045 [Halteria grandinella]
MVESDTFKRSSFSARRMNSTSLSLASPLIQLSWRQTSLRVAERSRRAERRATMPSFLMPFWGTSSTSSDPCALKTPASAVMPLFSSLSLPALKCLSFKSAFSLRALAIISPPSGPRPQLVTFRVWREDICCKKKSKDLIPAGPKALSDKLACSILFPMIALTRTSRLPGSSSSFLLTNMSLKFTLFSVVVPARMVSAM